MSLRRSEIGGVSDSYSRDSQGFEVNIVQEVECNDVKYLHSRLNFAFKIWPFIENAIQKSSWNNIKSVCYGTLCQIVKIEMK